MTIGERIKAVRKSLGQTQQSFGDTIGLKRNTIANYEINQIQPSDRTISDICRLFNVSEMWLREGDGEMFLQLSENEQLIEVLTKVEMEKDNPFIDMITAALKTYYKLPEEKKNIVKEIVDTMLNEAKKKMPQIDEL